MVEEMMSAEFLAAWHSARQLHRGIAKDSVAGTAGSSKVSTYDIMKHAQRTQGEPVSLAVERAIRTEPEAAFRYRRILAGFALAYAPLASAASDGSMKSRRVGPYTFEIVTGDGSPILLIRLADGAKPPNKIELHRSDESLRVPLSRPVNGAIFLSLDPAHAEGRQLAALIADPVTEIFVL
jgi:hypothetical protein